MLESGLVTYLEANGGLTLLTGARIYPLRLPQSPTLPAVVYQQISNAPEYSHEGSSNLAQVRIQFSCWSTTLLEAKQIADELEAALGGYRGLIGGRDTTAFVDNRQSDDDPETGLYREIVDVIFWNGG